MTALHALTAIELAAALRRGEVSPVEVAMHYLDRVREHAVLGAFAEVTAEAALSRAGRMTGAPAGRLWGLPLADKDLVARAGVATRYGSRSRAGNVPRVSDPLAAALDHAGAVSLGKTSTSEFGLTGFTEPRTGSPARDPWAPELGAGGSSGGAAVAVAAGLLPVAPGSDGGGSIRIPAATVGVVGLKPSRGRLPLGSGMDSPDGLAVAGPLARSAADAAFLLDALADLAPYRFATGATDAAPFLPATTSDPERMRIGVTTVSPWDDDVAITLDPEARAAVDATATVLARLGHDVGEPAWHPHGFPELFRVLWRASAARLPLDDSDLDPDLGRVEPITAWLVREGRALDATRLLGALAAARVFERETITAFAPYEAVLTPALAQSPRPVGWYDDHDAERAFAQQVQYAPYSSFVNVAGLPAIVLPMGLASPRPGSGFPSGHPVSVQLVGRPGGERALLALAAQLERARGPLPAAVG